MRADPARQRTDERTNVRSEEGWPERRPTRGARKEGEGWISLRERERKPRTEKKRFLVPAAGISGLLRSSGMDRYSRNCAMRRARNRGPRLIKRRRAIVNDTPRLVVKDRGISKRVTAVTPPRSIDRNRLRGRGQRGRYTHARTHASTRVLYKARLTTRRRSIPAEI